MTVEILGPFNEPQYRLVLDGFLVPHVRIAFRGGDEEGPNWTLIVDGRFATDWVTREEIQRWAFVVANMGAVCSGFSSHGEHSQPMNRFGCRVSGIGSDARARWQRDQMRLVTDPEDSDE